MAMNAGLPLACEPTGCVRAYKVSLYQMMLDDGLGEGFCLRNPFKL